MKNNRINLKLISLYNFVNDVKNMKYMFFVVVVVLNLSTKLFLTEYVLCACVLFFNLNNIRNLK